MTTTSNSTQTAPTAARVAAVAVSLGTFGFLFVSDAWRADNLFLVPDLILCVLLVAAAAMRGRMAVPALILALGLAAGVLITSAASYAVDGRLGAGSLAGAVGALVTAVVLVRSRA